MIIPSVRQFAVVKVEIKQGYDWQYVQTISDEYGVSYTDDIYSAYQFSSDLDVSMKLEPHFKSTGTIFQIETYYKF